MQDFRKLAVWDRAMRLCTATYRATQRLPPEERYGLRAQMRSAAVSIPSNIAEGAGRGSNREFARFLHIANGSANELETLLDIARRIGYLRLDHLVHDLEIVRKQLRTLILRITE